jgi:hypothetical protein
MRRKVVAALFSALLLVAMMALAACGDDNDKGGRKASIGSSSGNNKPDLPPGQEAAGGKPDQAGSPGRSATAPGTQHALANLQKRIQKRAEKKNAGESFAVSVNSAGRIELQTSAGDDAVQEITATTDENDKKELAKAKVEKVDPIKHDYNRVDDVPSFWNGAGINVGGGYCSNGYAARRNSDGKNVAVTAGHCAATGTAIRTESGAQAFGTVIARYYGGLDDFELVGGSSYAGRVYTGGVTSTSSIPVVSAGDAYVGSQYCVSGRTSGTPCGLTAESTDSYVCFTDGYCRDHAIQVHENGAGPGPGDSGGTFFFLYNNAAYIRGSHMGGNSTTSWEQSYTEAAAHAGLSIVTG